MQSSCPFTVGLQLCYPVVYDRCTCICVTAIIVLQQELVDAFSEEKRNHWCVHCFLKLLRNKTKMRALSVAIPALAWTDWGRSQEPQDCRSSGRDLNSGPLEYETGVLTSWPGRSVSLERNVNTTVHRIVGFGYSVASVEWQCRPETSLRGIILKYGSVAF
jgi:hypothetical protein